jgi:hypothetical protein
MIRSRSLAHMAFAVSAMSMPLPNLLHGQIVIPLFFIKVFDRVAQSRAWHSGGMFIQNVSAFFIGGLPYCFLRPRFFCLVLSSSSRASRRWNEPSQKRR